MLNLIAFLLGCLITLFFLCLNAPVGYEDETGFHYGETNISTNAAFTTYEERRDLYEQQEFNKKVFNLLGLWLSGFLGGFSLMWLLWMWFGRV